MYDFAGGLGLGVLSSSLICEEVAFGCSGIMAAIYITDVAVSILRQIISWCMWDLLISYYSDILY